MAAAPRIPRRSEWLCRWFAGYVRRYFRRHFNAVRESHAGHCPTLPDGPVLVVVNHPSWWDPLLGMLLASVHSHRELYAPIDAAALARYGFLSRLGLFGIEMNALSGVRTFLTTGAAILERPNTILAVTAQGRFTDPRERPVRLLPGIGHLAQRIARGIVVPVAFEYPFWNERLPEALAYFGQPIPACSEATPKAWTTRIAAALESAQDVLAHESLRRDPKNFKIILQGRQGIGGVYDRWRWLKARLTGRRFHLGHGPESGESA